MKLMLNDSELDVSFPADASLGSVLLNVQDNDIMDNQVLASIWIDGDELTADRLSEWRDRPISDFSEAKIEAPSRNEMALLGLCSVIDALNDSITHRNKLVDDICQGRAGQAVGDLSDYLSTWNGLQQTIGSVTRLLEVEISGLEEYCQELGSPLEEQVQNLNEQLTELKSALEAGDLVLIGDIIEYEFGELTSNWVETLEQIGRGLSEQC